MNQQPDAPHGFCGLAYGASALGVAGPGVAPGGRIVPGAGQPQVVQAVHTPPCLGGKCQLWHQLAECCAVKAQVDQLATLERTLDRIAMALGLLADRAGS